MSVSRVWSALAAVPSSLSRAGVACTPCSAVPAAALAGATLPAITTITPLMPPPGMHDDALWAVKREYQPSVVKRKRRHGFLRRNRSKSGKDVLNHRRSKGRWFVNV